MVGRRPTKYCGALLPRQDARRPNHFAMAPAVEWCSRSERGRVQENDLEKFSVVTRPGCGVGGQGIFGCTNWKLWEEGSWEGRVQSCPEAFHADSTVSKIASREGWWLSLSGQEVINIFLNQHSMKFILEAEILPSGSREQSAKSLEWAWRQGNHVSV